MISGSSHSTGPDDEVPDDLSPSSGVAHTPNPQSLRSTLDPFPYFAKFYYGERSDTTSAGSWISDLELMHHYATTTYQTLPRSDEAENIWQVELPKMAFKHPFLMHQILAILGCHLAYQQPHDRPKYSLQALCHQSDALLGLRIALTEITAENCHALFATSSLLLISAFASLSVHEQTDGHHQPNVDDILDIFLLIRGMQEILTASEPTLQGGPFGYLFLLSRNPTSTPLLEMVLNYLDQLTVQLFSSDVELSVRTLANCEISRLSTCIRNAIATAINPEYRVTTTWPTYLAEEFLTLILGRHPVALAVLAPYCLVIHSTESMFWYTRGWGSRMATAITSCMDSPWKEFSRWPLEHMACLTNEAEPHLQEHNS